MNDGPISRAMPNPLLEVAREMRDLEHRITDLERAGYGSAIRSLEGNVADHERRLGSIEQVITGPQVEPSITHSAPGTGGGILFSTQDVIDAFDRLRAALDEVAQNNHREGMHDEDGGPESFRDCADSYCSKARAALEGVTTP
jgi:hypothetical protein